MSPEELNEERELLQKAMKELRQQIRENGDASGEASKQLGKFNDKLKDFDKATKTKDISEGFNKLNKSVKQGTVDTTGLANEFQRLTQQAEEHGVSLNKETKARMQETRNALMRQTIAEKALNGVEDAAKNYIQNYVQNLKAVVGAVSSANNVFDMSASVQKLNIDLNRKQAVTFANALGDSAAAIGILFGPGGAVAGAIVGGIAKVFAGAKEIEAELLKFGIDIVLEQTKRLVDSFNAVTKVGGVFANGVMDLRNMATSAGLSIKDMAKVVVENKNALASFGGTVAGGAERLTKAYSAMTMEQRKQLMNLGISVQDQLSATADYMDVLARAGTLRGKSEAALAAESYNYMQNLKTISAITGEDAKAAQKRARDAATQSAVQSKLQSMGGESMKKFDAAIRFLPEPLAKAAQQMQVFGTVIDPELAVALSQMPAAQQMLTRITSGVADSSQGLDTFTQDLLSMRKELGGTIGEQARQAGSTVGAVNAAFGSYGGAEQVIQSMMKLGIQAENGGTAMANAQQTTIRATETTDGLTNSLSEAQVQFNKMATQLEQDLIPAIDNFAKVTNKVVADTQTLLLNAFRLMGIPVNTQVGPNATATERAQAIIANPGTGHNERVSAAQAAWAEQQRAREEAQSVNKRAAGGVAYGPTLTGEDGPEAHIPLKGGSIPMNIDFGPVIQAMNQQSRLTEELIGQVRDSKDVQERILNASY